MLMLKLLIHMYFSIFFKKTTHGKVIGNCLKAIGVFGNSISGDHCNKHILPGFCAFLELGYLILNIFMLRFIYCKLS